MQPQRHPNIPTSHTSDQGDGHHRPYATAHNRA